MFSYSSKKKIGMILKRAAQLPPFWLSKIVDILEQTEQGRSVVSNNPDRRLYAILRPTPDEYLQRLRALLELADEYTSMFWQISIGVSLPFIEHAVYIAECRDNGKIVCETADDYSWHNTWLEITSFFANQIERKPK